jgi:hypothetical protein
MPSFEQKQKDEAVHDTPSSLAPASSLCRDDERDHKPIIANHLFSRTVAAAAITSILFFASSRVASLLRAPTVLNFSKLSWHTMILIEETKLVSFNP